MLTTSKQTEILRELRVETTCQDDRLYLAEDIPDDHFERCGYLPVRTINDDVTSFVKCKTFIKIDRCYDPAHIEVLRLVNTSVHQKALLESIGLNVFHTAEFDQHKKLGFFLKTPMLGESITRVINKLNMECMLYCCNNYTHTVEQHYESNKYLIKLLTEASIFDKNDKVHHYISIERKEV